jgi:hypothetical protein
LPAIAQHVPSVTPLIIGSSKTVIAASGCTHAFWLLATVASNQKHVKPEAAITVFELLMMGGLLPETC